jgi:hypothetical protein
VDDEWLSPEWLVRALAHPELGTELHELGVRNLSGFGPPEVYVPPGQESWIRERIAATFEPASRPDEAAEDESRSWPVPFATFWPIFRLAVEEGASARRLAKETDGNDSLTFVNRIKAGVLVTWVEGNPEEARRRLRMAELPPGFSATRDGVVFPNPPKPA